MKIFEVPQLEQIEMTKKDGSKMIVSINPMITQRDLDSISGDKVIAYAELAVFVFGGKAEDYKDIPITVLSNAVRYAQEQLGNPHPLTETKQG